MSYREYLRILIQLQLLSAQKKRALDMIELNLQSFAGLSNFRVNHCIVGIKNRTEWTIEPVFLRVPAAFLRTGTRGWELSVKSGFAYD